MRGWPDDEARDAAPSTADVEALIAEGRFGRPQQALAQLDDLLPSLEPSDEPDALLLGLYARALLLRSTGAPTTDTATACDLLERAAVERGSAVWTATACAMRAKARLEAGDVGSAVGDLARVDLDQVTADLPGPTGHRLLEALASTYARLRLHDRLDDVRQRIEQTVANRPVLDRATHWAAWSTELAGRALEPVAGGGTEPDQGLLEQAVDVAGRLQTLPAEAVPPLLRRTADGVRALASSYRGRPAEALRLLGQDAFAEARDLPPPERQIVLLAAIHAHALVGSIATARTLDDGAGPAPAALPHLVLDVCRARERLWLETHAGGDVVPVLQRLTELLVRLGWQGMELVAETARQALEHQALRTESRTDALTGVGNRRALDEELRHMLRFSPLPVSLLLVDVDDFKRVNDRFTHVVGDEVLRRVAASLSEQLRVGDRLLRYGGDEFVVLLPRTGDQESRAVASRMADAIARLPWGELAEGLSVGITTGCAAVWSLTGRRPDADAEGLFRRADEALLEAKRHRGSAPAPRPWPSGKGRRAARGVEPDVSLNVSMDVPVDVSMDGGSEPSAVALPPTAAEPLDASRHVEPVPTQTPVSVPLSPAPPWLGPATGSTPILRELQAFLRRGPVQVEPEPPRDGPATPRDPIPASALQGRLRRRPAIIDLSASDADHDR